jgi:hypothetical protein
MSLNESSVAAGVNVQNFGELFEEFLQRIVFGRDRSTPWAEILDSHFSKEAAELPVLIEPLPNSQRVNLQVALEKFLQGEGRTSVLHGIRSGTRMWEGVTLAQILPRDSVATAPGSAEYSDISIGSDNRVLCLDYGLYLISEGAIRYGILVSKGAPQNNTANQLRIEIVAEERGFASGVLRQIHRLMATHNVFRGKVVELGLNPQLGAVTAHVLHPTKISRQDLVLPLGILELIERHTVVFSQHRDTLLASGRHLRRGLLLYGPPGTGKTLTLSYLIGAAPDWTVVLVTGNGFGALKEAIALARDLQPAMVILEDVDLIAQDRSTYSGEQRGGPLFELLNEMDGLAPDVDIVFALTTNKLETLESALASRPGRIDLAVEIPVPDAEGRRKLLELYSRGLEVEKFDLESLLELTHGVSASFIKELLRKSALLAAIGGTKTNVTQANIMVALREMPSSASLRSKEEVGPERAPD